MKPLSQLYKDDIYALSPEEAHQLAEDEGIELGPDEDPWEQLLFSAEDLRSEMAMQTE